MNNICRIAAFFLFFIWGFSAQAEPANEPLNEYECLHLNIGLLALLDTDNRHYQRKDNQQYDSETAIGKGLLLLRNRGESCPIKQRLYLEAAEYSLHYRKLEYAAYFLDKARSSVVK